MNHHAIAFSKGSWTYWTFVWSFSRMSPNMNFEGGGVTEPLSTVLAQMFLLLQMLSPYVLKTTAADGKVFVTVVTLVWSLTWHKKIMHFAKSKMSVCNNTIIHFMSQKWFLKIIESACLSSSLSWFHLGPNQTNLYSNVTKIICIIANKLIYTKKTKLGTFLPACIICNMCFEPQNNSYY